MQLQREMAGADTIQHEGVVRARRQEVSQGNSQAQTQSLERTSRERRRVLCEYECVLEGEGGWLIC